MHRIAQGFVICSCVAVSSGWPTTPAEARNLRPQILITAPLPDDTVTAGAAFVAAGEAVDDSGIERVEIAVRNRATGRWLQADGTWMRGRRWLAASVVGDDPRHATWSLAFVPDAAGAYFLDARAIDGERKRSRRSRASFRAEEAPTSTAPQAAFAVDSPAGPAPHVVQFADESVGEIDSWDWNFGDGATSNAQNPIHSYAAPGVYTVQLTVSGPDGSDAVARIGLIDVGPTAAPPAPGDLGEFVAFCPFSHRLPDDPIVFPGQPGQSHIHSFFGSTIVDAFTTLDDMLAGGTTCDPVEDRSSYWVPTLWDDGVPVEPEQATFYYLAETSPATAIRPFPLGLRVIAGNPRRTGPDDGPSHYKWSCRGSDVSSTGDFAECPVGHELELLLEFPDCWNGSDLDSVDHKSHMAYSAGGQCPSTHPVPVPRLQYKLRYPISGGPGVTISNGAGTNATIYGRGYTAHGDFFNAWEADAQQQRVVGCLHPEIKCGADGSPS